MNKMLHPDNQWRVNTPAVNNDNIREPSVWVNTPAVNNDNIRESSVRVSTPAVNNDNIRESSVRVNHVTKQTLWPQENQRMGHLYYLIYDREKKQLTIHDGSNAQ